MSPRDDGIYMQPDDVLAELSMTQEFDKMWLLVEGKHDVIFFKSLTHCKINNAKIVALCGWKNVVLVAQKHPLGHKRQVIGIVDQDYRVGQFYPDNVICTDMHSLESMMFWSSDFHPTMVRAIPIKYFATNKPINIFLNEIKDKVLSCCLPLSKYRIYCYKNGINISFKELVPCNI